MILARSDARDCTAWNRALSSVSPTTSFTAFVDLRRDGGFLPVRLDGRDTGFFFYYGSSKDLAAHSQEVARFHIDDPIVYQMYDTELQGLD